MADALRNLSFVALGLLAVVPFIRLVSYHTDFYYHEPGVGPGNLEYYRRRWLQVVLFVLSLLLSMLGITVTLRHASKLLMVLGPWADLEIPWCIFGGYIGTFGGWAFIVLHRQHRFLRRVTDSLLRCNACGYSLRGTDAVDGRIRCPECGHERTADELADEAEHLTRFAENESKILP